MASLPDEIRKSYGHYEVESVLGRGAMGMVYLARDLRIGRKVALKTVQVDQSFDDDHEQTEFFKRLQREAELCGSLQHPNIVTLYEPGYENNVISYLATEYVDGDSLRQKLKKTRPLPVDDAIHISRDLLRGLAFAHEKGIIHRDIKPANILLTSSGQAKLADFGIARPKDSTLTVKGEMLGTPNYMSPEQVKCTPVTPQSDLFSVGVVMYELLTGTKPFAASDLSGILRNVVEVDPPLASAVNPAVPEPVARVVAKLMAKHPDDRYGSAAEALDDLVRAPRGVPVENGAGVSTVSRSAPAPELEDAPTFPSATDTRHVDRTPQLGTGTPTSRQDALLYRAISGWVFWGAVFACLMAFGSYALLIRQNTNDKPTVVIPSSKRAEFEAKKREIGAARNLAEMGQLQESLDSYDRYLAQYPMSIAARTEREATAKALEEAKAKARTTVTVSGPKKKTTTIAAEKPSEETEKKPGFFRRLFGRGKPPPKKP